MAGSPATKTLLSPPPSGARPSQVHWLPCTVAYDGPTRVSSYFRPRPVGEEEGGSGVTAALWEARFRGRRMLGVREALPSGAVGLLVTREFDGVVVDEEGGDEYERRTLRAWGTFDAVTHWRQDEPPAGDETAPVPRWLEWIELSRALHD